MEKKEKTNKISIKKDCFVNSLKDVNYFLCNINKILCINKFIKKLK